MVTPYEVGRRLGYKPKVRLLGRHWLPGNRFGTGNPSPTDSDGKEGFSVEKKGGYEGRIKNTGAQVVKAPFAQPKSNTGIKKTTGKDLRSRAGSK